MKTHNVRAVWCKRMTCPSFLLLWMRIVSPKLKGPFVFVQRENKILVFGRNPPLSDGDKQAKTLP